MMERCLRTEATHLTRNKLESLVALHLDDMHYVHDIMQLQMQSLNNMLCEHLLNTLLIPLYVYSLDPSLKVCFCLGHRNLSVGNLNLFITIAIDNYFYLIKLLMHFYIPKTLFSRWIPPKSV